MEHLLGYSTRAVIIILSNLSCICFVFTQELRLQIACRVRGVSDNETIGLRKYFRTQKQNQEGNLYSKIMKPQK